MLDIEAKIVICTSETCVRVLEAVKDAERKAKYKIKVFSFGPVDDLEDGCEDIITTLSRTDENNAPTPVTFDDNELDTETAIVFWTSGTTGLILQIYFWSKFNCFTTKTFVFYLLYN